MADSTRGGTGGGMGDLKGAHPSQLLSFAFGAIYLLVGILGFFITGFDNFAEETDKTLIIFDVNPLHNVVHLAIGIAGLLLWRTLAGARTYGWILAIGYGAAFVVGLIIIGSENNFLNINASDNGLHIFSALVGLAIALWPERGTAGDTRMAA